MDNVRSLHGLRLPDHTDIKDPSVTFHLLQASYPLESTICQETMEFRTRLLPYNGFRRIFTVFMETQLKSLYSVIVQEGLVLVFCSQFQRHKVVIAVTLFKTSLPIHLHNPSTGLIASQDHFSVCLYYILFSRFISCSNSSKWLCHCLIQLSP